MSKQSGDYSEKDGKCQRHVIPTEAGIQNKKPYKIQHPAPAFANAG
jgi:hypothetical protein